MPRPTPAFAASWIFCAAWACQPATLDTAADAGGGGAVGSVGAAAGQGMAGSASGDGSTTLLTGGGGATTSGAGGAGTSSGGGAGNAGGGAGAAGDGQGGLAGAPSSNPNGIGCKLAAFCESFESVASGMPPDPKIWTRTSNDLVVDKTDAALGSTQALHVPALVNGFKYIREKLTIEKLGKSFFGRVFFRIDRRPVEKPNGLFHWTVLSADELEDYQAGKLIRIGGHIEADLTNWLRFNFQTHNNPGETGLDDRSATLDTKRWYCLEFYYSLPGQEARVWLDGAERPKLHWLNSVPGYTFPASISYMSFGWAEAHGIASPWEVWLDEIALDTQRIGCE